MNSHQNSTAMADGASPVPPASILSLYRAWDAEYERINRKGSGFTAEQMADLCRPHTAVMNQICSLDARSPLDVLAKVVAASYRMEAAIDEGWLESIRDEALAMLNDREKPDPLADAIIEFRAGIAALNAIPVKDITRENEDVLVNATYGPASDLLHYDTPPATSLRGVAEAIRFTFETEALIEPSAEKVLRSALAYLGREARS